MIKKITVYLWQQQNLWYFIVDNNSAYANLQFYTYTKFAVLKKNMHFLFKCFAVIKN